MIDVSVVLPVYNAELYLSEAIESVLAQSYRNIELIIINDGSTDNSLNIIEKFKMQDERVRVISRENKGLIYSLNEGISVSKGRYIARMDADDICFLDRLEKQVQFMDSNNLDICGGHYLEVDQSAVPKKLKLVPINPLIITLSLVSRVPFAHPTVIFRRDFIEHHNLKYGCESFQHAEDLALWFKFMSSNAKAGNLNDVVLKYRVLSTSLSRTNKENLIKDTTIINRLHYNNIASSPWLLSEAKSKVLSSVDARILSEYIWFSIFNSFKVNYVMHLPLSYPKEVLLAFLRQARNFFKRK
ncbi:glycosyltransferase family 2 protein [Aeromonas veronii]|uniref:glycosyltransferase family 2 protein n=1 Tax=Aeromonas veronii TaxID=654 RepID=UPI0027152709|nr:glycosyltransferase [Aeromonas veronii]WLD19238.1 glycosyltransferase [Aeromonas veronii]